jgi:phosphoglycerol geranylgeranyltransferase
LNVIDQLTKKVAKEKVHLTLIDPDEQDPIKAGRMACTAMEAGTDGIMIGGSTAEDQTVVDRTVMAIKEICSVPTILFPGGTRGLSSRADAIFYISLLNSSDPYFITGAHAETAHLIKKLGIEVIPVGYIIVEPGMTVGRMGKAQVVPRDRPELASSYALVAEFFGMKMVYLEAGSGAHTHIPSEMIEQVKSTISLPLIVGGGIRTVEDAQAVISSGADIIVQGTAVEEDQGARKRVADVIRYLKEAPALDQ